MSGGEGGVLVLTVGTGNAKDLEGSLIAPVLKSVGQGKWKQVVLLPSRITAAAARLLQERIGDITVVDIQPLPETGQENDADACFGHFNAVLAKLVEQGVRPDSIVADFTRGTKAMSAALVLAAVRLDIPRLRYLYGDRDMRGTVLAGTERVGEIRTGLVTARRRIDLVADLMRHGDFGAAISVLPDLDGPFGALWPSSLRSEAKALRGVARVYAAWDRLDYRGALREMDAPGMACDGLPDAFRPADGVRGWLKLLAKAPERSDKKGYAAWLRVLACDLLANAERRVRDRHFEDALLRTYRILELIGQFRLFDRGYDSGGIPPDDPVVAEFRRKLRKGGRQDFGSDPRTGNLIASRELATQLLKHLGDPLAPELLRFDKRHTTTKPRSRNQSVLIHGFTAQAPAENEALRAVLGDLGKLLVRDDAGANERLALARRLDFGGTP